LLIDKAGRRERRRKGTSAGAAIQANRLLTRLRTFFGWCVAHDLIAADPSAGVRKPAKEKSRDRVLTDDEIRALWAATAALNAPREDAIFFGPLFRLLLLTGQRPGEVGGMCWSEIDLDARTWTIPGARTKNGKEHIVHLSAIAVEVLPRDNEREFIFGSLRGKAPAAGFGRAKARLDAAMGEGVPPWVIHDLRRSATTIMARLGIAPHVADKVLNHTAGTIRGVAAVYNRFQYLDERRAALEALGRFVESLVRPVPANVVELRPAG
jgi:integrase